jgi:hypothetical protein
VHILYALSSMTRQATIPRPAGLSAIFTYSDARAAGVSDRRLYSYRDLGYVESIGRGLYRWAEATETDPNLLEIALRVPRHPRDNGRSTVSRSAACGAKEQTAYR